jgi:hypothetical protein
VEGVLFLWADAGDLRATRHTLAQAALGQEALLIATHIAGAGLLRRAGSGSVWQPVG